MQQPTPLWRSPPSWPSCPAPHPGHCSLCGATSPGGAQVGVSLSQQSQCGRWAQSSPGLVPPPPAPPGPLRRLQVPPTSSLVGVGRGLEWGGG